MKRTLTFTSSLLQSERHGGVGHTRTHLGDLVELPKQLVEHDDELFGGAVAGQPGEAHDVGVENTERRERDEERATHEASATHSRWLLLACTLIKTLLTL